MTVLFFYKNYRLPKDKTGTTKAGALAPQDMKKVRSLALIEMTALFDTLGIDFKHHKAIKVKIKGNENVYSNFKQ